MAQMKTESFRWVCGITKRRSLAVSLVLLAVVWLGFSSSGAQNAKSKRITSVQVSDTPRGARVTVVADLSLTDYEAFRRGPRFYVKLLGSDLVGGQPRFRGNGFDEVVDMPTQNVRSSARGSPARIDAPPLLFNRMPVENWLLRNWRWLAPVGLVALILILFLATKLWRPRSQQRRIARRTGIGRTRDIQPIYSENTDSISVEIAKNQLGVY